MNGSVTGKGGSIILYILYFKYPSNASNISFATYWLSIKSKLRHMILLF